MLVKIIAGCKISTPKMQFLNVRLSGFLGKKVIGVIIDFLFERLRVYGENVLFNITKGDKNNGVAIHKTGRRVWCIDGDGAALMHMGAMAVIGSCRPENLVHVIINNGAHETVGGMPTAAGAIDFVQIALACGYTRGGSVSDFEALDAALEEAKGGKGPILIEVKCGIGAREDLGRPTAAAIENKRNFMEYLAALE